MELKIKFQNKEYTVLYDADDHDLISQYTWRLITNSRDHLYVIAKLSRNKMVRMHRLITNAPKGKVVDHLNHNTLDNRKENLRVCTHAENLRNRSPKKIKNKTGTQNISFQGNRYKVRFMIDGKRKVIASEKTLSQAVLARDNFLKNS